jgi:hypothetical protein
LRDLLIASWKINLPEPEIEDLRRPDEDGGKLWHLVTLFPVFPSVDIFRYFGNSGERQEERTAPG